MLHHIQQSISQNITTEWISSLKTNNGDTQQNERIYIEKLEKILTNCGCTFQQAGSQQSKDFRNIQHPDYEGSLNIEAKMTKSMNIIANDTLPSEDTYYIVFFTGNKHFKPQYFWKQGNEFISKDGWEDEYLKEISKIKQKFCINIQNKREGHMSCYVRPNWRISIKKFLT